MPLTFIALQSGSNGNCLFVDANGTRLLFDAGISANKAAERLDSFGVDIHSIDALLISHEHSDHTCSANAFHRKFHIPLFMTRGTFERVNQIRRIPGEVNLFKAGDVLQFNNVKVHTLATPHDAVEAVAFVVESDDKRLGILTDLGHVFPQLEKLVPSLDAIVLESNYDPDMLATGRYAPVLQERIRGGSGHLSNQQAAQLVASFGSPRLQWVCLAHLSAENNTSRLALRTHRDIAKPWYQTDVASRIECSAAFRL